MKFVNDEKEIGATVERRKHRKTHGLIGFAELAREVANCWKTQVSDEGKQVFHSYFHNVLQQYKQELKLYQEKYIITKSTKEYNNIVKMVSNNRKKEVKQNLKIIL